MAEQIQNKRITEIPRDKTKLITWAEGRRQEAFRIPEFQSKQNLAFLLGRQWGVWDPGRRRFNNPRQQRGDPNAPVRITINKIAGIVERVIARLTKTIPRPEARPVSDTASDVNTAKVATRILDHEINRLEFDTRLIELYFWVFPLGWSFFHVRWDPTAGAVAGDLDGEQVRQGEIALDEVPAFEMFIDPNARRWRDAKWCIRSTTMTKEAVFNQYGVIPEGADAADSMVDEFRLLAEASWHMEDGRPLGQDSARARNRADFIAVHQLWLKPGDRRRPEGLVFTWAGKTILEGPMPFPYQHGELPFVPFQVLPALGGGPAGRTWITDLVGMQRDYNDSRSREATIRRVMTPKILAAKGQIDPQRITSRVEVIDYNPTGPAPVFQMPDGRWMSQFEQGMDRADQEMGERAGQTDVSSGVAATSAPAASILALQEADETKLAITAKEQAQSIQNLGWQVLMLVKQFWSEQRSVRTYSKDGRLEVQQFSASDIQNQLDVHVSTEAGLPRSKTARVQLAIDLWSQGIIADPQVFVRMLDLPGTDFVLETLNIDAQHAEREIARLIAGEEVPAPDWHNHEIHIAKHNEYRKSEEYEQLDDQAKTNFDSHVLAHQMVLQQAQLTAAQSALALGPGMEGGGEFAGPETTNPTGENGEGIDLMTGQPQDPLSVAAGLSPSQLEGSEVQAARGVIGGVGNPGGVPGIPLDTQAALEGN